MGSDNTTEERCPFTLNVLYKLCPITTQRQQLILTLLYEQYQKKSVMIPQKKNKVLHLFANKLC